MSEPSPALSPADSRTARVTVLYADVSGFTAMSERLDPEAVTDAINACFTELEAAIVSHRGVVDRFIGDCIIAVFGSEREDSGADEAVAAAADMRAALEDFHVRHGLETALGIHIGVATGTALLVEIGGDERRDVTLSGPPVALASRLEEVSERGQIFVGPDTYAETSRLYEYRPLEPIGVRGVAEPVPIYEYVRRRKRREHVTRGSERRQATVVFAYVAGFDELATHLDPERQTQILNLCFAALGSAVRAYGGVIDKYIGATVMALFGIPNAIQDAPTQAINATIEMRKRLATLSTQERLPVPLSLLAGVNTGLVIAGDIGGRLKREFTVMGDTVNLAARLKEAANAGQILIGPETHRYVRDDFELAEPTPLRLKGKRDPVPAYAVSSQRERTHRVRQAGGTARLATAMVGRDAELSAVRERLGALRERRGGSVAIVGEAGVGKSRLTSEVLAFAESQHLAVLTGRCQAVGSNLRFHPFVDLFRQWAHVEEEDTPEAALERVRVAVETVVSTRSDEVFPFLAALMGLTLPPAEAARLEAMEGDALEGMTTRAVRQLIGTMADAHPLVLLFEDLHWADASSLDLLAALLPIAQGAPLLTLLVCRPDYEHTSDRARAQATAILGDAAVDIRLPPLDEAHALALVRGLLGTQELPLVLRTMIARTEGNPFYIEEVLLSLIESGAIQRTTSGFAITAQLAEVKLPGTIQEVIMARVDRLDPSTRQVLQIASVVGRSFFFSIMREVLRRHAQLDADCERDLAELRDRDILLEREAGWSVADGEGTLVRELEYVFRHALAQDTIYESLLLKVRREHHELVAETIEASFADRLQDFYGMLAYHFGRAENLEKAEDYLFRAGEEASRSAASIEALAFFEKASELYFRIHGDGGDPTRKALLEKNIGLALLSRGRLTESIPHFDRALTHLGVRVPQSTAGLYGRFAGDFVAVLLHLYVLRGWRRTRAATPVDREFFRITGARARAAVTSDPDRIFFDNTASVRRMNRITPDDCDEACGLYAIAGALFSFAGISTAVGRRFLDVARGAVRSGNLSHEFDTRHLAFNMNYIEGNWADDDLLAEELVERAIQSGLLWDVQTYLGLACDRLFRQGRFADAQRQLDRLAELRDSYGYEFAAGNHEGESAMFLLETRDLDAGVAQAERYLRNRHEKALQLLALGVLTNLHVHRGDLDAAETTLAQATAVRRGLRFIAPWHESTYALARLQCDVAQLWRHHDQRRTPPSALSRRAKASRRAALANAARVAMNRVEITGLSGTMAWLVGDAPGAQDGWWQAIRHGQAMDARPELGRVYAAMARALTSAGDGTGRLEGLDAGDYAARAEAIASELGLEWDRRQLAVTPTAPAPAADAGA